MAIRRTDGESPGGKQTGRHDLLVRGPRARETEAIRVAKCRSRTLTEIPLHLLPHAVARQVREWGDAVYRISVKRTHWHHFNVTVRTKPVPRELAARALAMLSPPGAESGTGKDAAGGAAGV